MLFAAPQPRHRLRDLQLSVPGGESPRRVNVRRFQTCRCHVACLFQAIDFEAPASMVFSSFPFLFFFLPLFLCAYFLAPSIWGKNLVTLICSLLFYGWGEPWFVLVLL